MLSGSMSRELRVSTARMWTSLCIMYMSTYVLVCSEVLLMAARITRTGAILGHVTTGTLHTTHYRRLYITQVN